MDALLLLALILLNGVFAMAELAMIASREARLEAASSNGQVGATVALNMKRAPTRLLSTVQIGITSIGILNGIVGEAALAGPVAQTLTGFGLATGVAETSATLIVVVVITYASIVIGELLPKRIAQSAPEQIAALLSRPMNLLATIAAPFVWLLSLSTNSLMRILGVPDGDDDVITDEEIQALLSAGARSGLIEPAEFEMVRKVFRLDDRRLGSFMTPRQDIVMLASEAPLEENLRQAVAANRTRYPVIDGDTGDVSAIIHTRTLLRAAAGDTDAWPPSGPAPLHVPESLSGRELFERLHEARVSAAIVVDEYGDVQGMVTISDLFNAVVGDPERRGESPHVRPLGNDRFIARGLTPALDLQELLELESLPNRERARYDSLGGMMQELLGHLPRRGDVAHWQGWRFEVSAATRRRVQRVKISRAAAATRADAPDQGAADPGSVSGPGSPGPTSG